MHVYTHINSISIARSKKMGKIYIRERRFGFNGQMKDDEIYGEGNSYTAEYWQYDPRLGRRWNVDPEFKKMPDKSPYSAFFNNPIFLQDKQGDFPIPGCGNWCGVTTIFGEFEIGAGLGYGLNYVTQRGRIYDEVGKTKFKMTSALYIVNQNLHEGSRNPSVVIGATVSGTGGVTQNWGKETFLGVVGNSLSVPIPVPGKIGAFIALGLGFSSESLTLQLGIGVGIKISSINPTSWESVSLTDKEAKKVSGEWVVDQNSINPSKVSGTYIGGFTTTLKTKDSEGRLVSTGITLSSGSVYDKEQKKYVSDGIWKSDDYYKEATQVENENK